jgi:ribosome-associated protein
VAEDSNTDEDVAPTRREARAEAAMFRRLAESLARGKPAELPNPPFEGELREAVLEARRLVKNARPRQIRRVASLLRSSGSIEMFTEALEGTTRQQYRAKAREAQNEAWRARLLAGGDEALGELVAEFPSADRRRLRQLMRQARRAPEEARSKRAATALLRAIRELAEPSDADADEETADTSQ